MNEQLIVKNFGPIKDATVDFKRVTVFIGPTGGGKSTLAKLVLLFNNEIDNSQIIKEEVRKGLFKQYGLNKFFTKKTYINSNIGVNYKKSTINSSQDESSANFSNLSDSAENYSIQLIRNEVISLRKQISSTANAPSKSFSNDKEWLLNALNKRLSDAQMRLLDAQESLIKYLQKTSISSKAKYIPAERIFVSSISYAWSGFMRDDIGLPKVILDFANRFSVARRDIFQLAIPFLNIRYTHKNDEDYITTPQSKALFRLAETASGIQSVVPLLVLLEHLTYNTEQAQSFIIEEPELNLYPTAQQGLLNWLVEKCTKGENDLTITTHSPYLLAHFNTLLFAYQVAQNHPERADEIAKIVPRESWLDPKEFAAYHVEGQKENGVRSIINPETGLISYNGLDAIASAEA
ncbi:MAG: hypothetical protein EOP45_19135, partial [Sphingobacteriaceae bacterium]